LVKEKERIKRKEMELRNRIYGLEQKEEAAAKIEMGQKAVQTPQPEKALDLKV